MRSLLLASLLPCIAVAADYIVAPGGSDAGPGSLAQPWATIQKAANTLGPGDRALIRAGTYDERVTVNVSGSAAGGFVTFENYPGESPLVTATVQPPQNADTGLFLLIGRSYVVVRGLELASYKAEFGATNQTRVPCGVHVRGASHHIEIRGCKIHDIWNHFADGNAFGIAVYGDATTPMSGIVIDGNEVFSCKTGNSETIAINGNVTDWEVTNNLVHDNTNIGIDAIGYENTCCGGTSDPVLDRARDGLIRGNTVWACTSTSNPAYGNSPGAGGIYVDGGTRVLIERNVSYQNDIGVELASEHQNTATDFITVRGNFIWRNKIGGIFMGGYASNKGRAENNTVRHNTLWQNDTLADGNGEMLLQFYVHDTAITHNVLVAGSQNYLLINPRTSNTGNTLDYNVWSAPAGAASAQWQWKAVFKTGFTAWQTASGGETHSAFTNPLLVNTATIPPNLHLQLTSPAIDAGDPAFLAASGESDVDGAARITGVRSDIGADELAPFDSWRVQAFGANATNDAIAGPAADPDGDGIANLTEHAFALSPLTPSQAGLPIVSIQPDGGQQYLTLTFTRSLTASDATFTVQTAVTPGTWLDGSTYGPAGDTPTNANTTQLSRTPGASTETIVVRDNVPVPTATERVMRVRVAK